MSALYFRIDGQIPGTPVEGGPFSGAQLCIGANVVATGSDAGWYINDGAAFGDANLTGTTWPIILGQAK